MPLTLVVEVEEDTGTDSKAKGGSGVVIVRYQIGAIEGTAKATGGSISFYGENNHTFVSSGDFNNTSGGALTIECLGGGGSGGNADNGGGGGWWIQNRKYILSNRS